MRRNILLKTNALICVVVVIGFLITAILSYQANYSESVKSIEQVSSLASEGTYNQLSTVLSKPVNISLTMANDSLLRDLLSEGSSEQASKAFTATIQEYLANYKEKCEYDSVFLVSAATGRYYSFEGLDRSLEKGDPENEWYYNMLDSKEEYLLNVDNNEVAAANDEITVFVNCKIRDVSGEILGIVGVGLSIDYLQVKLETYEKDFGVNLYFIDKEGDIQLSADYTGYQKENLFDLYYYNEKSRNTILGWKEVGKAKSFWTSSGEKDGARNFVVTRYIPEVDWTLVVEQDTTKLLTEIRHRLYLTVAILIMMIAAILLVITYVIRGFDKRILGLTEERQQTFRVVTEQLYDNIYEINITGNCAAGESTVRYFESLGVEKNIPFNEALHIIAEKQIKEEYREGYIASFSPENVLQEFEKGNVHLRYEFLTSEDDRNYFWMRIDANIYQSNEDGSIHMFIYRRNIDAEKRQALQMERQVQTDEMTGLYNKATTQNYIEKLLAENKDHCYGFFIFDIDDFKGINDQYGHAFGDFVIAQFAQTIKEHFQKGDVAGRIGGDEFAAFVAAKDEEWITKKARELSQALDRTYEDDGLCARITASIGVAVAPKHGNTFEVIYKNADMALYQTKGRGRNGYTIY